MRAIPPLKTKTKEWLGRSHQQLSGECTLFTEFHPKPGGQTLFWEEFVPFGNGERSIDLNPGYRNLLCRGGRGAGKSYLGAVFICTRAYYDPKSRGLISANDFSQLEKSTLVVLSEVCEQFNIPLYPRGDSHEETARMIAARRLCKIFDAQIVVLSANKFGGTTAKSKQTGRGGSYRYAWLDEWAFADVSAWNTFQASLGRGSGNLEGFSLVTTTLNVNQPYNHIWNNFSDPDRSEELRRLNREIILLTADNDSIDSNLVASLEASYTPELAAIELRGEYANLSTGRIARYFNRQAHVLSGADAGAIAFPSPSTPLHLSIDFNHNPASAIAAHRRGDDIIVVKEWHLKNSDTFELAGAIARWIVDCGYSGRVQVHGDATGAQKTANSKQSNWEIVWSTLRQHNVRGDRRYGNVNPSVQDSVNSLNVALKNDRILIHPSCKQLIMDLESVSWKEGRTGEIDKSDGSRSHWLDELRYLTHDLMPFQSAGRWAIGEASYSR